MAFNVAVQISGMPVPDSGPIHFHLELANQVLAVLPLKINMRT